MFTLKHFLIFCILQNAVSSFCFYGDSCLDSVEYDSQSSEYMNSDESTDYEGPELCTEYSENKYIENCPKDQSLMSRSDIEYFIKDKAEVLKIKEKLVNSYYPKAVEIFVKYMGELKEFQNIFQDRPEHMLHILHDMASLRQELEPHVEEIAAQLEQFEALEDNFNNVAKGTDIILNQLQKYKNICKMNCEDITIENRFGHKIIKNPLIVPKSAEMYCVTLKDLNDKIHEKLSEVEAQYDEGLNQQLENRDEMYAQKITELKMNLKQAAVKQFGKTMYDVLSLQDDFHHFVHDLERSNISSEIYSIEENAAEIDFKLIGLKRDLEKYRQYCMKCNINQRVKRNIFDLITGSILDDVEEGSDNPIERQIDAASDTVDELIKAEIDQIRESIQNNFTTMFEELDENFDDPDVIDVYITQLHPIQSMIEIDIKTEQEALHRLRSRIPEESKDKVLAQSKNSKQMIQNLKSTKQFIDQFISINSMH